MTKELKHYYQEVRSHLFCPRREKKRLLAQAHQMVMELQESDPDLGYSDVVDFLGEPQELAATFMEGMDPAAVEGYKKKKKRNKSACSGSLISKTISFMQDPADQPLSFLTVSLKDSSNSSSDEFSNTINSLIFVGGL